MQNSTRMIPLGYVRLPLGYGLLLYPIIRPKVRRLWVFIPWMVIKTR